MIRYDLITDGAILMHQETQLWYIVLDKTLQGLFVTTLHNKSTPTPMMVILTRDFNNWDHEEEVKEHRLEEQIRKEIEYEQEN